MEPRPDISVVVPVFNGAATLLKLFAAIREVMAELGLRFEALFVDDGSDDSSWSVIRDLKNEYGDLVRGVRLARNSGQQAATYCGLLEARGEWVVTIDDDLQPHPREIAKLWQAALAGRWDVLYGVYPRLRYGLVHRVGTRLYRLLMRRLSSGSPEGSSFRMIRAEVLRPLPTRPGPWILVDPVLAWHTSAFTSVVVEHGSRDAGRSGYSLGALFTLAYTTLVTYSKLPLRLMTAVGFLSAIVSFGVAIFYLVRKLTVGAQLGFTALIVTITFSSGLILLSLGIVGEYVSRIHTMGSGEPAFAVKAVL